MVGIISKAVPASSSCLVPKEAKISNSFIIIIIIIIFTELRLHNKDGGVKATSFAELKGAFNRLEPCKSSPKAAVYRKSFVGRLLPLIETRLCECEVFE